MVATNDIHYTYKEDEKAHDILLCIQTGKKVQDEDRLRYEGGCQRRNETLKRLASRGGQPKQRKERGTAPEVAGATD